MLLNVIIEEVVNDEFKVTFSVSDTGIGIANEQLDSLFDAFSQADASITRRFGGYAGYFLIGIALLAFFSEFYAYLFPSAPVAGQGETYESHPYQLGVIALFLAIVVLVVSALFAAFVSWEASLSHPKDRDT